MVLPRVELGLQGTLKIKALCTNRYTIEPRIFLC